MIKKRIITAALCLAMSSVVCSCGNTDEPSEAERASVPTVTYTFASTAEKTTTVTEAVTSAESSITETISEIKTETETSITQTAAVERTVTKTQTENVTEKSTAKQTVRTEQMTVTEPPKQTEAPKKTEPSSTVQEKKTEKETEPPKPAFSEGTYKGAFGKYIEAMDADVRYDITIRFEGGSYDYTVGITLSGGMEHHAEENYTGTYTVNGECISLTGKLKSGRIKKDGIELIGELSSFASEDESLTVRK